MTSEEMFTYLLDMIHKQDEKIERINTMLCEIRCQTDICNTTAFEKLSERQQKFLLSSIDTHEYGLSPRAINCLMRNARLNTMRDVVNTPISRLKRIRNLGVTTMNEIEMLLAEYNLKLGLSL